MRRHFCITAAVGVTVLLAACGPTHAFKDSDIPSVQEKIKSELGYKIAVRPLTDDTPLESLQSVTLMKVSDRKLHGYAKIKVSQSHPDPAGHRRIYWTHEIVTRPCEVTMAQDSDDYIWQCD